MIAILAAPAYVIVGILVIGAIDKYYDADDEPLEAILVVMWPVVLLIFAACAAYWTVTRATNLITAKFHKEMSPPVKIKRYRVGSWRKK